MNIQDALRETGKARLKDWAKGSYLYYNGIILYLHFAYSEKEKENYSIPYNELRAVNWEPYFEPTKCPACIEAGQMENEKIDRAYHQLEDYTHHLRKYHCTCKD